MKNSKTVPRGSLFKHRRGVVGLLAILPNLLLMIGLGAGILYAIQKGTPTEIVETVISGIMSPFLLLIEKLFAVAAPIAPALVALIPAFLVFKDNGSATLEQLLWGAGYGLALFILVIVTGMDVRVMAGVQASWTGSIIGTEIGLATGLGQTVLGFIMFFTYWTAGLALEIFVLVCHIMTGAGDLAQSASGRARSTQHGLLSMLSGNPDSGDLRATGLMLIIIGLSLSGLYVQQNGFLGVASTIYADESPPEIKLAASTHGKIAYPPNGRPVFLCFVEENMDMGSVTAEVKTPGGFLGIGSETVDKITLSYDSKTGEIYKYKGVLTKSLSENIEYKLIYIATNKPGANDKAETTLELVEISAKVKVNGKEIMSPSQTIYLTELTMFIEVEILQGESSIDNLALHLNGDKLQAFEANSGDKWITTYLLPEDGRYSFTVEALATGGQSIQLASWGVTSGSTLDPNVLIGAGIGIVVVSALLIYTKKREETK
jgi:hypothetical protein